MTERVDTSRSEAKVSGGLKEKLMGNDSLTITDNRTGKTFELPIH